jgi:hypothetical protein
MKNLKTSQLMLNLRKSMFSNSFRQKPTPRKYWSSPLLDPRIAKLHVRLLRGSNSIFLKMVERRMNKRCMNLWCLILSVLWWMQQVSSMNINNRELELLTWKVHNNLSPQWKEWNNSLINQSCWTKIHQLVTFSLPEWAPISLNTWSLVWWAQDTTVVQEVRPNTIDKET